jgi:hypothetical protein
MNLRDKFKKADKDSILTQTLSVKCVKIADEFAIGFKDWCDTKGRFWIGANTTKELLEIYKKEKQL